MTRSCGRIVFEESQAAMDESGCREEATMAFFEWTHAFSVGVEEIDQQHKRLMGLVNRLHDAIACGSGSRPRRRSSR